MDERDSILFTVIQGLGLNLSSLALLASAGFALGPLSLTGTLVALIIKLIGDTQLVRAYWLWQSTEQKAEAQAISDQQAAATYH